MNKITITIKKLFKFTDNEYSCRIFLFIPCDENNEMELPEYFVDNNKKLLNEFLTPYCGGFVQDLTNSTTSRLIIKTYYSKDLDSLKTIIADVISNVVNTLSKIKSDFITKNVMENDETLEFQI